MAEKIMYPLKLTISQALCNKYGMLSLNDLKLNAQWFTKGMDNIKSVRVEINRASDVDSVMGIIGGLG